MPRAIVTGSDSGIGKATAVALAEAGYDVGITWHTDEAGAKGTAEEVVALGVRAEVRQLDLTDLPAAGGRGGRIINVTSVHEHVPLEGSSAYCAAKGGLGLLTKVMALELAGHGILVNAVAPGEISTPMTRPGGGSWKHSSGPLHGGPATGQHDVDPHTEERPGIPLGRPGHARRSRWRSSIWPARRPATRPERPSSSTAGSF